MVNVRALHSQRHRRSKEVFTFASVCKLQPRTIYQVGDPFQVESVNKQFMKVHDDITIPRLIDFLQEFIVFSRTNRK